MRAFSSRLPYALVLLVLTGFAASVCPCPARAQILVANTAPVLSGPGPVSTTMWFGTQFTVGASPIAITSATAQIANLDTVAGEIPEAHIYSNSGENKPDTLLQTLTFVLGTGSATGTYAPANFTYAGAPVVLSENTNYYFVLANVGTGSYDSGFSSTLANTGSAGTVNSRFAQTGDSGASWLTNTGFQQQFTLSGIVIPEPSTLALLSSSLVCAGAYALPLSSLLLRAFRKSHSMLGC